MKGLRSVTILGEGFQATLTIQLDVRSYELFKDCKGAWKADPFFPLLATSVLRALHLSYHSLPRPCLPSGLWVLWQPEGLLSPLSFPPTPSQGGIKGQETVGQLFPDVDQGPSPFWRNDKPSAEEGGGGVTKKKGRRGRGLSPGFC